MTNISPNAAWQLRRLAVLAGLHERIIEDLLHTRPDALDGKVVPFRSKLAEFRKFHDAAIYGDIDNAADAIPGWLIELEKLEGDLITLLFSMMGDDAIEIIHSAGRCEGVKWGNLAQERKGEASSDARKALLVLNDYLVDGMPEDDNITIVSSEAAQITYNQHRCHFAKRFEESQTLAWLQCSSRQAWKDGFFATLGGIAHQTVSGRCQGDDTCMNIITIRDD